MHITPSPTPLIITREHFQRKTTADERGRLSTELYLRSKASLSPSRLIAEDIGLYCADIILTLASRRLLWNDPTTEIGISIELTSRVLPVRQRLPEKAAAREVFQREAAELPSVDLVRIRNGKAEGVNLRGSGLHRSSIPRTVGRRVKASIVRGDGSEVPVSFVDAHATRVGKETRKVLRLAGWDLRQRFRDTMEQSTKEVKSAEDAERKAKKASEWFGDIAAKAVDVKEKAVLTA
ncbi:hypothetical protein NMY22_g19332 [Coprinellus aureogranulatus]|nr:hypothetical protein NMY22_g19332 [Coprinellus aureogranulatus]